MTTSSRIRAYMASHAWAIDPKFYGAMVAVVERWERGERLNSEDLARTLADAPGARPGEGASTDQRSGGVAILTVVGPISPRATMVSDISAGGGTNLNAFRAGFRRAMDDRAVTAILLDVHSPGGLVWGVDEAAAEIRTYGRGADGGRKPVVAVANQQAASAAYWLASSADELVVTPSGEVGSIGVFCEHWNESRFWEDAGLEHTYIFAGDHKVDGNPYQPLPDDVRGRFQGQIDEIHSRFLAGVATGRRTTADAVRASFGDGRMFQAGEAVALGAADRIGTLEAEFARLSAPQAPAQSAAGLRRGETAAEQRFRLHR